MNRAEFRENLFKVLFTVEYHDNEEYLEQLQMYMDELEGVSDAQKHAMLKKYNLIIEHIDTIDGYIADKSNGWDISRISKADLTILRIAIFEMVYDPDVSVPVAIKEAVRIISEYGTDKSQSFVHGILAAVDKDPDIKKCEKKSSK